MNRWIATLTFDVDTNRLGGVAGSPSSAVHEWSAADFLKAITLKLVVPADLLLTPDAAASSPAAWSPGPALTLRLPSKDELERVFGEIQDEEVSTLDEVPPGLRPLLTELAAVVSPGSTLWLARDWEGSVVGMLEGDDRFDALAFGEHGGIAHNVINQPYFAESVDEYLAIHAPSDGSPPKSDEPQDG